MEEIAKIGAVLINDPLSLYFAAIIVCTVLIKDAVEASVKIASAERALFLSADKEIGGDFFFTILADIHVVKIRKVHIFCQVTFTFSFVPQASSSFEREIEIWMWYGMHR